MTPRGRPLRTAPPGVLPEGGSAAFRRNREILMSKPTIHRLLRLGMARNCARGGRGRYLDLNPALHFNQPAG
jgi:hypothetical protein